MNSIEEGLAALKEALAANTALTQQISTNTAGMVSFTQELQAGARLLCRLALALSWVLKTIRENWGVILLLLSGFAYVTNSSKLIELVSHLVKL